MTTGAAADAIARALAGAHVGYLFGLPGGGNNLDVVGACEAAGIRFVLAHGETSAAIMASAWAEVSGRVGACVVTRGPGAASAVNGAAQANQDRLPLLLICDVVDEQSRERIAHQYIDQRAMFAPVTKWSATVGPHNAEQVLHDALAAATTPPRGAVHLDIDPTSTRADPVPPRTDGRGSIGEIMPHLAAAQRPVVVAGVGARDHADAIRRLVAGSNIPVMMTYKAKGVVPDSGPNSAGTFTGVRTDGALIERADLVVAIGLDSIELIPNPWRCGVPVVSLAEAADPYRYVDATVSVVGPLSRLLAELPRLPDHWAPGTGRAHRERIETGLLGDPVRRPGIHPAAVVRAVRATAPAGSIATVDAGAHMLVAMPLWSTDAPGEVLISSGLATMGYALPAAVGAALARPDVRVYCFVGDGGLQMCLGELETLARLRANVTVIVFNDATLSLIQVKQRPTGHGGAGAVRYSPTDFAALAAATGVPGHRVEDEHALRARLAEPGVGPRLLDVRVHPDAYRHVIEVARNGALP